MIAMSSPIWVKFGPRTPENRLVRLQKNGATLFVCALHALDSGEKDLELLWLHREGNLNNM